MSTPRIWIPLPNNDFDVTEVAVPWKLAQRAGVGVVFATERAGTVPAADPLLIRGVVFGKLGAEPEPLAFYRELEQAPELRATVSWESVRPSEYDGLLIPGGHAQGMRQLLESQVVQRKVAEFWELGRPVAAICHGVLLLARAKSPKTGKSVLSGKRSTCLPKYMERLAYFATAWKHGRYYRTYDAYVEEEVRQAIGPEGTFERGPVTLFTRGTDASDVGAFVVEDGPYLSARWPGDAYLFGKRLVDRVRDQGKGAVSRSA